MTTRAPFVYKMLYYSCISDVSSLEFAHFDWQTKWEKYVFALHQITFIINSGQYLIVTNIVLHISYFGNFTKFRYSDAQIYIQYGLHITIWNTFHMKILCHKTFFSDRSINDLFITNRLSLRQNTSFQMHLQSSSKRTIRFSNHIRISFLLNKYLKYSLKWFQDIR